MGRPGHILLVDDEVLLLSLAQTFLEIEGFQVSKARHGHEAIAILESQKHSIDMLICDQNMPGLSGIELMQELKPRFPELPMVLSSGYDPAELEEELGVTMPPYFLRKPYVMEDMIALIHSVLGPADQE